MVMWFNWLLHFCNVSIAGIRLKFLGAADVHWSERHSHGSGKNRRTTTRHYRANETYFNMTVTLFGKGAYSSVPSWMTPLTNDFPSYMTLFLCTNDPTLLKHPWHVMQPPFDGQKLHLRLTLCDKTSFSSMVGFLLTELLVMLGCLSFPPACLFGNTGTKCTMSISLTTC